MRDEVTYTVIYCSRRWGRLLLTSGGMSFAFAAVMYAYGLAGSIHHDAKAVLDATLGKGTAWIVPSEGILLDPETSAILPNGRIEREVVEAVRRADPSVQWFTVTVGKLGPPSEPLVVYCDERLEPGVTIHESRPVVRMGGHDYVLLQGEEFLVRERRGDLPDDIILAPLSAAERLFDGEEGAVSWMVSESLQAPHAVEAAQRSGESIEVVSGPLAPSGSNAEVLAILAQSRTSRFDPFSFGTKFSAFVVNGSMFSVFGWAARAVFGLGILFLWSSARMGVDERLEEVVWFSVNGHLPTFTVILFVESLFVGLVAYCAGGLLGGGLLLARLPDGADYSSVFGTAFGMSAMFFAVAVLLGTLVPAQAAAARAPGLLTKDTL